MLEDAPVCDSYQAFVEHAPFLFLKHDVAGVLRYVSPAAAELIGYQPSELMGQPALDLIPRSEHEEIRKAHRAVQSRGAAQTVEHRIRHKNGDYLWFRTTFTPCDSRTDRHILTFSHSISQSKNIEAALRILAQQDNLTENKDYFRVLVSHVTAALRVSFGFITLLGEDGRHVRMLAFWKGKDFAEPYAYPLTDTPCFDVINGGKTCVYPVGIQARFPKDQDLVALDAQGYLGMPVYSVQRKVIGHLALLDNKPLRLSDTDLHLAKLFTIRAGIAIEQMQ